MPSSVRRSRPNALGDLTSGLKRHADALERLIAADTGARPALADRIEEILEIGLTHLGLEAAELGRVTDQGFSGWYAARSGIVPSPAPGVRTEVARTALAGGAVTHSQADAPVAFIAAALPDLDDGAVVMFLGGGRGLPIQDLERRFVDSLARTLSAAIGRHRGRQTVFDERDELGMILDNVRSYVASMDAVGRLVPVNEAARHARRPASSLVQDRACLDAGEPQFGVIETWEEDETQPHWMRVDRIPYAAPAEGTRLLVVATDVTDLVEKEKLLAKANAGLNQFAYIASHDLQEPLRKIGTFSDLMLRGLERGDREDVDYGVKVIKDSARRASALIHDLLAWSRLTNRPLERKPVSLPTLVRETLADLRSARPNEDLEIVDTMTNAVIQADASKLHQLMENLISNALKYRHADRPLRLALDLRPMPTGGFIFEIGDNGIGFDPAYAAAIFEPFRRLHGDRQFVGTGVGLAICTLVCERHGWTISAEGRPGEGATFRVTMPARSIR